MLALLPALYLTFVGADPAPPTLEARLAPLIKAHKGKVAVAVKHLDTGVSYYHNADAVMPAADLIEVAVMIEVYFQADESKLNLTDPLTLREDDKVHGSGILSVYFSEGAQFPVRDAVRLMMAVSDNTATNLLLDKIGIANVNTRMKAWGFPETRLNAKVGRTGTTSVDPERSRLYGLGSTTAREMAALFELLQTGTRARPAIKQSLLGHLKNNRDPDKFTRLLPPGTMVAHKDGSGGSIRTDAGIIETPAGLAVVCVLTTDNEDRRPVPDNAGNLLCARVARAVYDHFAAPPGRGQP